MTVLVIARDDGARAALVHALRKLGLRALGVVVPTAAVELLDGIEADVALVRGEHDAHVERLVERVPVVVVAEDATVERAVVELLRALGRPEAAALDN